MNLHSNSFEGSISTEICELQLARLTVDCGEISQASSPPFVECSCCTQCF